MNISIFAKPAFLNTSPGTSFKSKEADYHGRGHLQRVSSMIRGDQIADFLGAKLNPEKGYKSDVCIYVKPHVKAGDGFKFEGIRNYIDIVDGWGLIPLLEQNPEVRVIACSAQDYNLLTKKLPNNHVYLIPQHHCNYDREQRTRKGIKTVGIIGTDDAFAHLPKDLIFKLEERGIKLLMYSKFFSRQDIIDFYKQIDLQIVWRPYRMRLSNPLKIVNASSFGVPTMALDEDVFKEMKACYVPVKDLEDLLLEIDYLVKHPKDYKVISEWCSFHAENYHIDKVGKLYKQL